MSSNDMDEWKCPVCTFFNKLSRPGCKMCATEKPDHRSLITFTTDQLISGKNKYNVTEDKWECSECTFINDIKRPGCEMCANERPLEALPDVGAQKIAFLDCQDLVIIDKELECPICLDDVEPGHSIRLRECFHEVCRKCCFNLIDKSDGPTIHCPISDCAALICDQDIRGCLNTMEQKQYYDTMCEMAVLTLSKVFHCLTPDCRGAVDIEEKKSEDRFFLCPCCLKINCLECETQHDDKETCEEYNKSGKRELKAKIEYESNEYIKKCIDIGKLIKCPNCKTLLEKMEGCDWIQCLSCKLEICWCTKGPRWGPQGNGDTSGGCRCGVDDQMCDPNCKGCH